MLEVSRSVTLSFDEAACPEGSAIFAATNGARAAWHEIRRASDRGSPMTLLSLIILLCVAGLCGAVGQAIAGYSHAGLIGSIALGFIGALFGVWLANVLHLPELFSFRVGGESFPILWSIIGSALFVAVLSLFTRRRYYV
jgi:uncharacterized membrane protein YeaQ/YmgE (transglycosylase-associated protein family)